MRKIRVKIVGAGLAGCSCATILADCPMISSIDVYEKSGYVGGLCFDYSKSYGIFQYFGPHIFHTSNPKIINFVLKYSDFKPFTNRPIAFTDEGLARLPISVETLKDLKGESLDHYSEIDQKCIFDNIIRDYSKKQWGKPADKKVLDRLKIYEGLSGSYFNDLFEGLPDKGFSKMMERMLNSEKIKLILEETDENKDGYDFVIWTGPIDEIKEFDCDLKWRGTKFEYTSEDIFDYRLAPVYNICTGALEMTRSTDVDMLVGGHSGLILNEYPNWNGKHYPIVGNRDEIDEWIEKQKNKNLYCCGRLGTASYFDMDDTIENAFKVCDEIIRKVV